MFDAHRLLLFFAAAFLLAITPGPGIFYPLQPKEASFRTISNAEAQPMTRQLQLQAQPGQVEPEIAKPAEIVGDVQNDFGPEGRLAASARPGFRLQQSLPRWLQQPTHQILQPPRMR